MNRKQLWSDISIDTLRTEDGYRDAPPDLVRRAISTKHTTHLQTSRGTVAFRPFNLKPEHCDERHLKYFPNDRPGWNILVEFYPTGHQHGDELEYRGQSKLDALRFVLKHLNGRVHNFTANDYTEWWSNQASRDAWVLAVIDEEVLIEYEMPGTTAAWGGRAPEPHQALVLCRAVGNELLHIRNYTHRKLPKKWVRAMNKQGINSWGGKGQREPAPVPFPKLCGRCFEPYGRCHEVCDIM